MVGTAAEKILEMEVSRRGAEAVVVAHGEIDHSAVREFREALRDAAAYAQPKILVDLTDVRYMDSSCVYALLDLWRDSGCRRDAVRLRVGSTPAAKVLKLAGLERIMQVDSAPVA